MDRETRIKGYVQGEAKKIFKDSDIVNQLFLVFVLANIATYALQIFSGVTELKALWDLFGASASWVGAAFAVLILILIEVNKRVSSNRFFAKYYLGDFSRIGVFLILFLGSHAASIYLSLDGAKELPKDVYERPVMANVALIDIDSVNKYYGEKLRGLQKQDSALFEKNKRPLAGGGFRLSTAKVVKDQQAAISKDISYYQIAQAKAIQEAKAENKRRMQRSEQEYENALAVYQKDMQKSSKRFWWIAFVLEGLFFLCNGFKMWYLNESLDVTPTPTETDKKPSNDRKKGNERKTQNDSNRTGTRTSTENETPNTTATAATDTDDDRRCLYCNKDISDKKKGAKFCDPKHRGAWHRENNAEKNR